MELKDYFLKELTTRRCVELSRDVLESILSNITGKLCHSIPVPRISSAYKNVYKKPTSEDKNKIIDLYCNIITEYNLIPGVKYLNEMKGEDYYNPSYSGYTNNSTLVKADMFLFGEDLICNILYDSYIECPIITDIIYSPDQIDIVQEIWIKYSKLCSEIIDGYEEEISKSYGVSTVVMREGRYYPVDTYIFPTVSLIDSDLMLNYNSDFPETKIKGFLEMDKGGLMIFNGHPGCGKSTYLKSLIFKYPNIRFTILPQYLLLNQEAFRNFLFEASAGEKEKDVIFIVEDCEQLLIKRENNALQLSSVISDILNYTDGIFGDLTRTKFIFTFNTNLNNIDEAILRPGRLYLKYEFSPLIGENLEKLASKIGYTLSEENKKNGVPLAELYSKVKTKDLVMEKRPKRRIGFCSDSDEVGLWKE